LPRTANWDVQIAKNILISERWRVQLRAEYFNVLNHPTSRLKASAQAL